MLLTSVAIPPAAVAHRVAGALRARRHAGRPQREPIEAVLFDRDGTLVVDVPYNGDPAKVSPKATAAGAVARVRAAGLPAAVISNQSGVARGLLVERDVEAVNRRVEELLGTFDHWAICVHGPDDGCSCRKPAPGLVLEAAGALGVPPERCAVIGDTEADVLAARRAGARGILVPNVATRPEEVRRATEVAPDLETAVAMALEDR